MPTYNAAFSGLGGFYDGMGLLALNIVGSPGIVQSVSAFTPGISSGPLSIAFPSPVTAGNFILVIIATHAPSGSFVPDAYSISDTVSSSYTLVQTQQSGTGGDFNQNLQYSAKNIPGGANTISLGWSHAGIATNAQLAVLALEISGISTSTPIADKSQAWVSGTGAHTLSVTAAPPVYLVATENDAHTASGNDTVVAGYTLQATASNPDGPCCKVYVLGLSITCGSPPSGILGSPYAHLFPVSGGAPPDIYAITAGSLPPGLTLDILAGTVTGIPTATGIYPFTVSVTDNDAHSASVNCSITITAGGAWIIQEITAEFIPQDPNRPADPNLPGLYRYTVRAVNAAQAGTYLGFWGSFGGSGGGGSISSSGGGQPPGAPAAPPVGPATYAKNDVAVGSEPELSLNEGRLIGLTVADDPTDSRVDATIASTADAVSPKGAGYLIVAADDGKLIPFNSASPISATLPAAPPAAPWRVGIQNIGAGALTIAHNGNTIDAAAADIILATNQGLYIYSSGTQYYTERGVSGSSLISPLTTKGDIWGYSTVDARIPVGTNGQVLTADSTQALGVKWGSTSAAPNFADAETPGGSQNGSNVTFTLANNPNPPLSLILFLNGVYQQAGIDYTLSGGTITMTIPPIGSDSPMSAFYRY